jgi:GTP-binding protein
MARDIPKPPEGTTAPFAQLTVDFLGSYPDPGTRLEPALPELAFIGRSNVGKSSLLNALTGRKGLARVSATPGKTQAMNVFRLPDFYLIDLPGYGFAKASKVNRAAYRRLVEGYLTKRETLAGVVWLLDARHDPSKDDLDFQELLASSERPALAVLTKADKLTRREQSERPRAIAAALGVPDDQVQLVSAETGMGIPELGASILTAIRGDSA